MLLISLKNLIKKSTEVENHEAAVHKMQAVITVKCSVYALEIEQADMEADHMEALVHVCESKLGADSSAYSGSSNPAWK